MLTRIDLSDDDPRQLPRSLLFLFSLNGIVLALPTVALMEIVNNRVAIPLEYLPAYGAVAFMPASLKPLYSYIISQVLARKVMPMQWFLAMLLVLSGVLTAATSFVPKDGVVICFVVAFFRAVATAFPEFFLGTILVGFARKNSVEDGDCVGTEGEGDVTSMASFSFYKASSLYQSQAASARNLGSFLASAFCAVAYFFISSSDGLSYEAVCGFLFAAGCFPLLGAAVVLYPKFAVNLYLQSMHSENSNHRNSYNAANHENAHYENEEVDASVNISPSGLIPLGGSENKASHLPLHKNDDTLTSSSSPDSNISSWDIMFLFCLQALLVWMGLYNLFKGMTNVWGTIFTILIALMTVIVFRARASSRSSFFLQGSTLYLVLKQALPDMGGVWSAYSYFLFSQRPTTLQILFITSSASMFMASWFYSKFFAFLKIKKTIVLGTIGSALVTLSHICLTQAWRYIDDYLFEYICSFVLLSFVSGFIFEIEFIPSIVLATTNIQLSSGEYHRIYHNSLENSEGDQHFSKQTSKNGCDSFRYGTLVSCIDFGDQIGAWLSGKP